MEKKTIKIGALSIPWNVYGKIAKMAGGRDNAAVCLYRYHQSAPKGASVLGWVTSGIKGGWIWDNRPGAKELEHWCKNVFPKRQVSKAGNVMAQVLRDMADKIEKGER